MSAQGEKNPSSFPPRISILAEEKGGRDSMHKDEERRWPYRLIDDDDTQRRHRLPPDPKTWICDAQGEGTLDPSTNSPTGAVFGRALNCVGSAPALPQEPRVHLDLGLL